METVDAVAAALTSWWHACGHAAAWPGLGEDPAGGSLLEEARGVLQALAQRELAIPAEVPADSVASPAPWPRASGRPRAFNRVRRRRAAVLRLGVWDRLLALRAATRIDDDNAALAALQVRMTLAAPDVPPGIGPSLPYAGSAAARTFFDGQLRTALARLAHRHDPRGARFGALAAIPAYDDTVAGVHRWSGAWTCAVAAVYLDWLTHAAQGRLDVALRLPWREQTVRFRAPSGLVVLPTRERRMHVDLWTDLVLAQALQHDDARWNAAAQPWHRVRLAMHDLGERDRGGRETDGPRTLFRGLSIEMLYQTVFIGRAHAALAADSEAGRTAPVAPDGVRTQVIVDLPIPHPGQQANFELVLRWRDASEPDGPVRFARTPPPGLDDQQRAVLERWRRERARAGGSSLLDRATIDWQPATDAQPLVDDDGNRWLALGHGALWPAAGDDADWLDAALVTHDAAGWRCVPLQLVDDVRDGVARTWLFAPEGAAGSLRAALGSDTQSCWALQRAGLGAFVMAAADPQRGVPSDAG
jgi:hypothetical protein